MSTMTDISNSADVIDVRDLIARVEELREEWNESTGNTWSDYALSEDDWAVGLGDEGAAELSTLSDFLSELAGSGGDHQWEGAWYPVTLVRDSYFVDYAEQLAEDIGAIDSNASWPLYCIDWARAASDLQMDYSEADYDGQTYYFR